MADIDSISIELTANTQSAEDSIQRLIDTLRMLNAAAMDSAKESKVAQSIRNLAKAAREVSPSSAKNVLDLTLALREMAKIGDLSSLADAGKNLTGLAKAVNSLGKAGNGFDGMAKGLRETGEAFDSIRDKDVGKVQQIADDLSGMTRGPLFTSNVENEGPELGGMSTPSIGGSEKILSSNPYITLTSMSTPSIGGSEIAEEVESIVQGADSIMDKLGGIAQGAEGTGGELEDLLNANSKLSGEFETLIEDASDTSDKLGNIGDSSRFAKMSLAEMESIIGSVESQLQALTGSAENANEAIREVSGSELPTQSPYQSTKIGEFDVSERFANFRMEPLENGFTEANDSARWFSLSISDVTNALKDMFNSGISRVIGGLSMFFNRARESEEETKSFKERLTELFGVSNRFSTGIVTFGKGISTIPRYFGGQFIGSIQRAVKGFTGLYKSIARVARYRLIRSAIKLLTQGIGEGIKNLYAWSKTADHTFAASMDRIATASQYMGNSFAAMASPLVNAISPAIDFIADRFVELFNLINQIFARLSGATSYTAAKKVAAQWEDASKSASGSAKKAADEIKRTLLGFDEINKLNDNNKSSSSGGSGSGTSGANASSMFETRPIEGGVSSFADQLKSAFENANWKELGTTLGEKVNELVEKINFADAGKKVGKAINAWFSTKYWTLETINFTDIGKKIAEFLNKGLEEIDFKTLGASLVQNMTIIGDLVIGWFTNFNWGAFASDLSDFVKGMYDQLTKWFKKQDWKKIGTDIGNAIAEFVGNIDYAGLANSFYEALDAAMTAGLELLGNFFDALADKFKTAVNWDSLSDGARTAITAVTAIISAGLLAVGGVLAFSGANIPLGIGLLAAGAVGLGTAISLNADLSDWIEKHIELLKGILSGALLVIGGILTFTGANLPLGLGLMAAGAVGLAGTVGANFDIIVEQLRGPILAATSLISGALLLLGVISLIGGAIPLGIGLLLAGTAGLASAVAANWDSLKDIGKTAIKKVKEGWESIKSLAVSATVAIATKAKELWDSVKKGWDNLKKDALSFAVGVINGVVGWWDSVKGWWNGLVKKGASFAVSVINGVAGWWDSVKGWWNGLVKKGASFAVSVVNGVAGWWDSVKGWWNGLVKKGADFAVGVINDARDWWKNVSNWWNGVVGSLTVTIEPELDKTTLEIVEALNSGNYEKALELAGGNDPTKVNAAVAADEEYRINSHNQNRGFFGSLWELLFPTAYAEEDEDNYYSRYTAGLQKDNQKLSGVATKLGQSVDKNTAGLIKNTAGLNENANSYGINTQINTVSGVAPIDGMSTWVLPSIDVPVNAVPGEGFQTSRYQTGPNSFTLNPIKDTVVGVQADLIGKVPGSKSLTDEYGESFDTKINLTGKTDDSKTPIGIFGASFLTKSNLTGKTVDSKTLSDVFGTMFGTKSKLTGKTDDSKIVPDIYGTSFNTQSKLTGKAPGSKTLPDLFGASFNTQSKLTGKVFGSKTLTDVYGASFNTKSKLTGKAAGSLTFPEIFGTVLSGVVAKLTGKDPGSKTFGGIFGTVLSGVLAKLTGKDPGSKTFGGIFGTVLSGVLAKLTGKERGSMSIEDIFGTALTILAFLAQGWLGSPTGNLGLDNLMSEVVANLLRGWGGTPISALGLENLRTTIKAELQIDQNRKKVVLRSDAHDANTWTLETQALGGIFESGKWSKIPQYAGGTMNAATHGSLFLAGEAGPEIVGHVGGRTEVLNKSQLAAAMYSAVHSAMSGVSLEANVYTGGGNDGSDYDTMYSAMYDAFTAAMARSDERDREKVQLMREIASKEFTAEVTASSIAQGMTRMNRRAGTTVVPVGT